MSKKVAKKKTAPKKMFIFDPNDDVYIIKAASLEKAVEAFIADCDDEYDVDAYVYEVKDEATVTITYPRSVEPTVKITKK